MPACRPEDEAFQRAVAFITRAKSFGKQPASWAGNDGGFVYTPLERVNPKWKAKQARCGPTAQ